MKNKQIKIIKKELKDLWVKENEKFLLEKK